MSKEDNKYIWFKVHENFIHPMHPRNKKESHPSFIVTFPPNTDGKVISQDGSESEHIHDISGFTFVPTIVKYPNSFEGGTIVRDENGDLVEDKKSKWRNCALESNHAIKISKTNSSGIVKIFFMKPHSIEQAIHQSRRNYYREKYPSTVHHVAHAEPKPYQALTPKQDAELVELAQCGQPTKHRQSSSSMKHVCKPSAIKPIETKGKH